MSPVRDRSHGRSGTARSLQPDRLNGIGAVAVLALWLLRRVPAVGFPIRAALFLGRFLPVALWLLRRFDSRRPVGQPAPDRRAARRARSRDR